MKKIYRFLALCLCFVCVGMVVSTNNVKADFASADIYSDECKSFSYSEPYRMVSPGTTTILSDITRANNGFFHAEPGQEIFMYVNFNTPWDWSKNQSGPYTGELTLYTRSGQTYSLDTEYGNGAWFGRMIAFEPMDFIFKVKPDGRIYIQNYCVSAQY